MTKAEIKIQQEEMLIYFLTNQVLFTVHGEKGKLPSVFYSVGMENRYGEPSTYELAVDSRIQLEVCLTSQSLCTCVFISSTSCVRYNNCSITIRMQMISKSTG